MKDSIIIVSARLMPNPVNANPLDRLIHSFAFFSDFEAFLNMKYMEKNIPLD